LKLALNTVISWLFSPATIDQFHLPEEEEKYDFFYEIVNILLLFINN